MEEVNFRTRAEKALEEGYLMSLGTSDDGGVWVADVLYAFDDDLNIYWMSDPNFRHSKAIDKNNLVGAAITVSRYPGDVDFGLQISGRAERIGKIISPLLAIKYLKKKGKVTTEEVGRVLKHGYDWYVLRPEKMELIDEIHFGYEKKIVLG